MFYLRLQQITYITTTTNNNDNDKQRHNNSNNNDDTGCNKIEQGVFILLNHPIIG